MIDERLEIGTTIYYVEEDNNFFSRKKIFMTDKNGVEWYRYSTPLRTQKLSTHTIAGRVLCNVEGRVPSIEDYNDIYFTEDGVQVDDREINESDDSDGYFLDKDEALAWIEARRAETERIERS